MGRQSSRIWLANNTDHKEMVTWTGTEYMYHDKAYIWNGSGFELVWQKLRGLKLLYDGSMPIKPVSSENNKYLYFTENEDGSVIYRIIVNAKNPEKEEHYTSEIYSYFTAPTSSRGFAAYMERVSSGVAYRYQILNLEDGSIYTTDTFDATEYLWNPYSIYYLDYTNQAVSQAESGMTHEYAAFLSSYIASGGVASRNAVFYIAPTGISAQNLDTFSFSVARSFDIGRLADGTARGLMPRFFTINRNDTISVWEFGAGTEYGLYSVEFTDTVPFNFRHGAGGGILGINVVRDGKIPILDAESRIWLIGINTNSFSYTDTEIDSPSGVFDVSPDYKYAMTFEDWNYLSGTKYIKIIDIETKEIVMDVTEEIGDLQTTSAYFVGHKCIFVSGYYKNTWNVKYRLYKWR